jgi:hypothetical protein
MERVARVRGEQYAEVLKDFSKSTEPNRIVYGIVKKDREDFVGRVDSRKWFAWQLEGERLRAAADQLAARLASKIRPTSGAGPRGLPIDAQLPSGAVKPCGA